MEELEMNLNDIFTLLNKKNTKIKNHFDNMIKLESKIEPEYITKLAGISTNLNLIEEELKEIYYHLLNNNSTISKTDEELNEIKTYKIDNIIKKTFLPYMMLMKMKLENDM